MKGNSGLKGNGKREGRNSVKVELIVKKHSVKFWQFRGGAMALKSFHNHLLLFLSLDKIEELND